jgi:hypothetical protein
MPDKEPSGSRAKSLAKSDLKFFAKILDQESKGNKFIYEQHTKRNCKIFR